MSKSVRIIVLNPDESYAPELRADLLSIDGVKIVAELDDPAMLSTAVMQFPAEVVLVNLADDPEPLLRIAGLVAAEFPNLAVFALAADVDGQLVLQAMRSGLREFLTRPIERERLAASLEKAAATRGEGTRRGKLVAVIGSAGGVGATTLATNLAVELHDVSKQKVVVVDLDVRFGQVATFLDVQPSFTIADLCDSTESLEPGIVEKAVNQHACGLHVLARPNDFSQAESITGANYASVLGALQELYDFVVIDGPSRFDPAARAILDMCDVTCLIVQLLVPCVRNAVRIIEAARSSGYNLDRFRIICNRVSKESCQMSLEHVETTLNRKVLAAIPEDWRGVSSAINMGETLAASSPKSRARQVIRELAELLHGGDAANAVAKPQRKTGGLLGLFSD